MSPSNSRKNRQNCRRTALRQRARALRRDGYQHIAGTDEAGAGPLAGPLVAAAAILPAGARLPGVDDSKRLKPDARAHWAGEIRRLATAWAVSVVPTDEVDAIGPYQAALRGMERAVENLDPAPDYLLVDARRLPGVHLPQEPVIGGDGKHLAIAAASILAKVHRDSIMVELSRQYPGYGFDKHKGYGTREHLEALRELGPCPAHRRSYAPVRRAAANQGVLF